MGKTNALSLANNTVISNDIHRLPLHENVPPIYVSTHSHSSLEALKKLPSNALPWAIDHNGHLIYKLMPKLVEISDPIINQNTLKQSYVAPEQRAQKESLIDLQHDESNIKTSRDISANVQPYTKALSKQRRRECQSVLADIALTQRQMTIAGVHKVTEGVIHYIEQAKQEGKTIEKTIAECMKKYMYSDSGFGRLDQTDKAP
ncbi:MAG: hypothetical protein IT497_03705 [Ottowia sp.]|nr:hypothetical protein [Ottowia sp.]